MDGGVYVGCVLEEWDKGRVDEGLRNGCGSEEVINGLYDDDKYRIERHGI